jgi:aspartate aminotransferase
VFDDGKHTGVLGLRGVEERVVMMDSLSKRYSVCGARIGCIVSRNHAFMDACLRFGQARLCPPTVEQIMATAAEEIPDSYFAETMAEYQRRRDVVYDALQRMEGVFCKRPEGAFYNIARLPIDDADRFCRWLLTDFEEDGKTLMLSPAAGFYATPGLGKEEIRIAYVLNTEALGEAMALLDKALRRYRAETM